MLTKCASRGRGIQAQLVRLFRPQSFSMLAPTDTTYRPIKFLPSSTLRAEESGFRAKLALPRFGSGWQLLSATHAQHRELLLPVIGKVLVDVRAATGTPRHQPPQEEDSGLTIAALEDQMALSSG